MSLTKKRMLIFDDNEGFAKSIAMKQWVKTAWVVTIETNWQTLDNNFMINNSWDIIITDVDMPGAQFDGHEMIRTRILERNLNVPIIVMSGAYGVDLKELREKHGGFFSAYLSKDDKDRDFSTKLRTEVDKATSGPNPLDRLGEIFDELGKLDERIAEDSLPKQLHQVNVLDLSDNETIGSLIDQCDHMEDTSMITDYLWEKVKQFRKKRRPAR